MLPRWLCKASAPCFQSRCLVFFRAISSNAHFPRANQERYASSDQARRKYLRKFSSNQKKCLHGTRRQVNRYQRNIIVLFMLLLCGDRWGGYHTFIFGDPGADSRGETRLFTIPYFFHEVLVVDR